MQIRPLVIGDQGKFGRRLSTTAKALFGVDEVEGLDRSLEESLDKIKAGIRASASNTLIMAISPDEQAGTGVELIQDWLSSRE